MTPSLTGISKGSTVEHNCSKWCNIQNFKTMYKLVYTYQKDDGNNGGKKYIVQRGTQSQKAFSISDVNWIALSLTVRNE